MATAEVGDDTLVTDLLQVKSLFANNHLSDVLFIFSSDSGDHSDVPASFEQKKRSAAGDHLIPAHRLVLSLRSGAFQSALLRAKSSQVPGQVRFPLKIHVQDTPYRVFYVLLRFLYTNELSTDGEEADHGKQRDREEFWQQLLRAAFVYLVPSLVDICVKRIVEFLLLETNSSQQDDSVEGDDVDIKKRQLENRTLDVLVFTDTVLATNPSTLDRLGNDETDLPLVTALKTGNNAIVRRLLVDENAPFFLLTDKVPLLFLASASGNVRHCEILIEQNQADVNLISQLKDGDKEITAEFGHGQTPLHIASRKGHSAVVELLLQHNAASNLPDGDGNTALHCAANIETVEVLLNSSFRTNANIPNRRGRTPLHIAAARGDVSVVAYLIHHGAQQDIVDDQGQNAFHHAAANGHTAVTLILLHENEAAIAKKAAAAIENDEARKGEPNDSLPDGSQLQDGQAQNGDLNTAAEEHEEMTGFDINQEDLKGNTALHLAAMSPSERCQKMLQLLLENGADPNRTNWFGYTALHLFCSHQSGPESIIDAFIEHGVNIHAQSLDGSTALHLAVGRGSEAVAVALVRAGAFVHLVDAAGRSVVDLVESTNQGKMLVPVLRNISHSPELVSDEQVVECSSCHTTFRLAMRKHHCRHCGRTVCYNCSSNKIAIPKFQVLKPNRVCDTCFDVLSFRKLL
ncbi:hypothetical protein BBJ29_004629 [Phytophthora kernoviae]|uniref:FYVE-type domain-containing protein n=1 Tax=Phytophthora kernoviae TaxID=325452 RepID=A0A3F2RXP6_9STRA|nr:hypothetical protein BBJ29_004629 [Phytophthora kernoviae]RLN66234.1 hypothetical protein BBP00_00002341 [Phytophthora kernoviae]